MTDTDSFAPLPHLRGPGAAIRQAMAAHFLRDCAHVVEIGGAGLPMTDFLTHRLASVTVVDPKIAPFEAEELRGAPCRVRHLRAKLQAIDLPPPPAPYGLVMLGFSMKPFGGRAAVDETLLRLAKGCHVAVIEHPPALARATDLLPDFLAAAGLAPFVTIDMTIGDGAIDGSGFSTRRFMALRPRA